MAKNIVLIGMMGCGKTTVGRLLSRRLGLELVDTDALIEQREGRSIPDSSPGRGRRTFAPWSWRCAGSWPGGRVWSSPAAAACPFKMRPSPR